MKAFHIISNSSDETKNLGQRLAGLLQPGDILCLFGDLGSGKTTLIKGLAQGLNVPEAQVNSPTFVLLNVYEGKMPVYHFDFYRLETQPQIAAIGYDEFLYGQGVSVIEWAERFGVLIPKEFLGIKLTHQGFSKRGLEFAAIGKRYEEILKGLKSHEFARR